MLRWRLDKFPCRNEKKALRLVNVVDEVGFGQWTDRERVISGIGGAEEGST